MSRPRRVRGVCAVEGCEALERHRQWCKKHYHRWLQHGDPTFSLLRMDMTPEERAFSSVVAGRNGCWIWTGCLDKQGYGRFTQGKKGWLAHRWVYQLLRGDSPADKPHLDHICHTNDESCPGGPVCMHRRCVNPDHLEPVTARENALRGRAPSMLAAQSKKCQRGHDLVTEKSGRQRCDTCRRLRAAARRERVA